MTSRRHLLPGIIEADGRVNPTPVIVTLRADGVVTEWTPLDGHEPHSTTPLRALLCLSDGTIRPL
ncbi:MAG: hypothetical protein K2F96_07900 [Muribaculaceae bacterium]|nr:hypothetical protein [Muribaculaceae bacterium]